MHATRASLRNLMLLAVIGVASAEAVGISRDVAVSAIAWGSLRCPPDGSTNLPTPTYGTEKVVFQSLWNSFVVDVALPADVRRTPDDVRVGNSMVFTTAGILPLINTTSTEIVTKLLDEDETQAGGYLMAAWRSEDGAGGLLYRAEHPTILVDQGDRTTLSVSYEPYYAGLLTPALRLLQGTL
ncbi:798eaf19-eb56-411d-a34d-ce6223cadfd5 [Thermothielavioides terrestris]|uniref:798eaf19-eb56-411d-a34d-ce6223cadfd5 n=1 Tax=Thermothielavioides terrestris TaxID=2587410 RepID=A0A3S4C1P5_9PEZI|nr:798eaf19-eb56-411d-a34d-ce6223cadfd5 [Thermothielavioides terrestris]